MSNLDSIPMWAQSVIASIRIACGVVLAFFAMEIITYEGPDDPDGLV